MAAAAERRSLLTGLVDDTLRHHSGDSGPSSKLRVDGLTAPGRWLAKNPGPGHDVADAARGIQGLRRSPRGGCGHGLAGNGPALTVSHLPDETAIG